MAGPYPPNHASGTVGRRHTYPHPGPPAYPGSLPPPVPYRQSRRWLIAGVLILAAVAAMVAAVTGYAVRGDGSGAAGGDGVIAEAPAKAAIQGYLNALADRDIDTIARNTLCGIYDRVTDRRSDDALAKMSSDEFREQFPRAEVTSVDKIVYLSNFQAQALFTMRVASADSDQPREDVQGVAQLLSVDDRVLVCSYVLRPAGSY